MLSSVFVAAIILGVAAYQMGFLGRFFLAVSMPERPAGFVSDFAGVLDEGAEKRIAAISAELKRGTTAELAVVTIGSLKGLTVEQ